MKIYHDSETVGLMGPAKLHQFSIDGGPVEMIPLKRGWQETERERMIRFIQKLYHADTTYIGFNVGFDLFHLYRCAHQLVGLPLDSKERPVQPFRCKVVDLQVHAMLKSPLAPFAFSRSKSRSIALVRRIPKVAKDAVIEAVSGRLAPMLPAGFRMSISEHEVKQKPELISLSWSFIGGLTLKRLMQQYGLRTMQLDEVWPLPEHGTEQPWLPYPDPAVHDPIEAECDQILDRPEAPFWKYAELDVLYLQILEQKLGMPEPDYNSSCAHAVAYTRYYGFGLDHAALDRAEAHYGSNLQRIESALAGVDLKSPKQRLAFLRPYFPILASTGKNVLKALVDLEVVGSDKAKLILDYGPTRQRLLQIQKVRMSRTGRAHPELRVMGTATNRMAGSAGLNWQGIAQADEIEPDPIQEENLEELLEPEPDEVEVEDEPEKVGLRSALETPMVGDFSSFEVCIGAAVYKDEQLQADLDAGIDIHGNLAALFHPKAPTRDYKDFMRKVKGGDTQAIKCRKQLKSVLFGTFFFATAIKVSESLGVTVGEAEKIQGMLFSRYPRMKQFRAKIESEFLTADTEKWMKDSIRRMKREQTDLTGFARRWEFEASVAETMWELGSEGVRTGQGGRVIRNQEKGVQTIDNAVRSAFLGSAIAVQAAISRQAGNMPIQATGASLCKKLMSHLWESTHCPLLQVHDELVLGAHPNFNYDQIAGLIQTWEAEHKALVPSLHFDFKPCSRWSDK